MDEVIFFDTLRQGLWVGTLISAPILGAALVGVGVGSGVSIQEMWLTLLGEALCYSRRCFVVMG